MGPSSPLGGPPVAQQARRKDAVHPGKAVPGRMATARASTQAQGRTAPSGEIFTTLLRSPGADRELAAALQRCQVALLARLPTARTTSHLAASLWPALRSASVSLQAGQCGWTLTLELVSPQGAEQDGPA